MKNFPAARTENIVVQNLAKETLIYDLDTHRAVCLNETAALVYQLCDGGNSISAIGDKLSKRFGSDVSEDWARLAVEELKNYNLLANGAEIEDGFAGLSRREAIRRVGLTSLIALPVISSLVAPTASMAASVMCVASGLAVDVGAAATTYSACVTALKSRCCSGNAAVNSYSPGDACDGTCLSSAGSSCVANGTAVDGGNQASYQNCQNALKSKCCSGNATVNSYSPNDACDGFCTA